MRFSINIPNFGDFADARTVARVAATAEEAGWDGLFVWDHVVHSKQQRQGQAFGDPWMLLTAALTSSSRSTASYFNCSLPVMIRDTSSRSSTRCNCIWAFR